MSSPFTVIIATCDRPDRLERGLRAVALAVAEAGDGHRVIVADNGTGGLAEGVVASLREETGLDLAYVRTPPRNKTKALNAAVREAETGWFAFTDDDTEPRRDWLAEAAAFAERTEFRVFGGRIVAGEPEGALPAWLTRGASGRAPDIIGVLLEYDPAHHDGELGDDVSLPYGANIFVHRDVFDRYGGYDERLWDLCGRGALGVEDSEFAARVRAGGERFGYCPSAVVVHATHHDRATLRTHFRFAYWYGWREPLIFFDPQRPPFEPYRLRLMGVLLWGCVRDLLRRDPAGAVERVVKLVMTFAGMVGRLSVAYRRRSEDWGTDQAAERLVSYVQPLAGSTP